MYEGVGGGNDGHKKLNPSGENRLVAQTLFIHADRHDKDGKGAQGFMLERVDSLRQKRVLRPPEDQRERSASAGGAVAAQSVGFDQLQL